MKKIRKSDYDVLPRSECKIPKNDSNASNLFIAINRLNICQADDVAHLHEGKDLDWLQQNRQIIRMTKDEFNFFVPLLNDNDKKQSEIVLSRNSKQRIIVSTEIWMNLISNSKKGFSKLDMIKKIDEVIENLVNKHMYEYENGERKKINLFES